ncbi:MAG: sugar nucleotide-binding protein [Dehalococcoidia bacterium]|nr:sugar nucleotide-binding protein [Dehalococcoidia bacterium]
MNVLLLGANGQLGSDIVRLWDDPDVALVGATRADADVTDVAAVARLVREIRPTSSSTRPRSTTSRSANRTRRRASA